MLADWGGGLAGRDPLGKKEQREKKQCTAGEKKTQPHPCTL